MPLILHTVVLNLVQECTQFIDTEKHVVMQRTIFTLETGQKLIVGGRKLRTVNKRRIGDVVDATSQTSQLL